MKRLIFLLGMIICLGLNFPTYSAVIEELRLAQGTSDTVRFVAELSAENSPTVSRLEKPARLVIDFPKTTFSSDVLKQNFKKVGFVGGLRMGTPFADTSRVVLDLPTTPLTEKHFLLKPQGGKGWRFVLDLTQTTSILPVAKTGSKGLRPFSTPAPIKKQRIIVLDPGHGGQDPGAISRSGYYEKNITLNMAKETKTLLEKEGYKVVLTRDKDIFIPLRTRIKKAHNANADLFISIHADSAKNKSAKGLSVYTISEKASDAEAAALAERENKADIIMGMDLSDVDPMIGTVLLDLEKKNTMDNSAQYARYLVGEMKKKVTLISKAHRQAGFVVLKSPSIPSVLVELGYLSNKTEDKNLQKKSYRKDLAEALVRATNSYFKNLAE